MITCPICSWAFEESKCKAVPYPAESSTTIKNRFKAIIFCENCGVGIALPLVANEELEKFYAQGHYWGHSRVDVLSPKEYPVPYALALSRWGLIESLLEGTTRPVSILDIGAGHGFLGMAAAKSQKFYLKKYACVEQDKALVESVRKTWQVYFSDHAVEIESHVDLVDGEFDCIVFSHVLEHQTNPKKLLETALKRLAAGGFIFIDVPNQDYLFKSDVFPHMLFFSTSNLRFLLEGCGLTVNLLACYGHNMNRSPMNYKNRSRFHKLAIEIITRTKAAIPETILLSFFTWYFGMSAQNDNGTWIRAVAENYAQKSSVKE